MNCPCHTPAEPGPPTIPAGLTVLPRQIGTFPDFRVAMLADLRRHAALDAWQADGTGDLGLLLLELWSVLCDAVSFYDEVHAHEAYLGTARLEPSVRGLVDVLGYRPRPAVAAEVPLAVGLSGNRRVDLPAGTAFRSQAFGDEPPQVFELLVDSALHPWNSKWAVAAPRPTTVADPGGPGVAPDVFMLGTKKASVDVDDVVLVTAPATAVQPRRVVAVEPTTAADGDAYLEVTFDAALTLGASTVIDSVVIRRATRSSGLWKTPTVAPSTAVISAGRRWLVLDGVDRSFRVGARVVVERSSDRRQFAIDRVSEVRQKIATGTDSDGNTLYGFVPATRIRLDVSLNHSSRRNGGPMWTATHADQLTVRHGFVRAGTGAATASSVLSSADDLALSAPARSAPGNVEPPSRFALFDDDDASALVNGMLSSDGTELLRDGGDPGWGGALRSPVSMWGNVVDGVRGESVRREVLGSGDASLANQQFTPAKAPLTYVAAETDSGVASSLDVYVDGVRWAEVRSFFGVGPDDRAYIVRLDAAGAATITFGDGVHGARLPTGAGNVTADYRFGAGAAAPPAGTITQLARPVRGLEVVRQPVDALGGADAEDPDEMRTHAPRSALVLGRAVSISDAQALAATVPGVRTVRATWGWQADQQRPALQVFYVGQPLPGAVESKLRANTDPLVPIAANAATSMSAVAAVQVEVAPDRLADEVLAAVAARLTEPRVGFLQPEQMGIGASMFRSALVAAILDVPGTHAVTFAWIAWQDSTGVYRWLNSERPGVRAPVGSYFDFAAGGVWLNGEVVRLG